MIQIKVVLELPADLVETVRLEEQWENEGGATSKNIPGDWIFGNILPFYPGDSFKVVSGDIEAFNGQFYYCVNLQPIEAGVRK